MDHHDEGTLSYGRSSNITKQMSGQSTSTRSASATVAEEEYLQILFWLQEAGLPMTGANVAHAMQLSAPTVHEMVGRLEHAVPEAARVRPALRSLSGVRGLGCEHRRPRLS
jgi:hypothetical protein